jgi:phospholipid transport system substrate-binding protein
MSLANIRVAFAACSRRNIAIMAGKSHGVRGCFKAASDAKLDDMRKRIVYRLSIWFCGIIFGFSLAVPAAFAGTPVEIVESFHRSLLEVMKSAATTKVQGRYEKLESPIGTTFNLPVMMQIASGTKWRTASDAEKAKLVDAFKRVSVGTYAQRFDGFSGEKFETIGVQDGPSGSKLVQTRIVRPNNDPVPITYVTRKFGDEWRVVDVIVSNGISELAVRRSEYNRILNSGGPGELVSKLNQKADAILAGASAN